MKLRTAILPLLAGLGVVALSAADKPKGKPVVDKRKYVIETPLKGIVAGSVPAAPVKPRDRDAGKDRIETPLKRVVGHNAPGAPVKVGKGTVPGSTVVPAGRRVVPRVKDMGKLAIEVPLKRIVARTTPAVEKKPAKANDSAGFKNPKVEPGKVNWHASFEAAVKAAGKSRKPVLLFQMIGNLDERFS